MANLIITRLVGETKYIRHLYEEGMNSEVKMEGEWDYSWCMANWGVKWDLYKYRLIEDRGNYSVLYFLTANNSPILNGPITHWVSIDIDQGESHVLITPSTITKLLQGN